MTSPEPYPSEPVINSGEEVGKDIWICPICRCVWDDPEDATRCAIDDQAAWED